MKLSMALIFVSAFSTLPSIAMAELDIAGEYSFSKYACESGAKPTLLLDGDLMKGSLAGDLTVTPELLSYKMVLNYKLSANFAKFTLEVLGEQLVELKKDAETNAEEIVYLTAEIEKTEKMAAGQSCTINSDDAYAIKGDEISTTVKSFSSTCEDMKNSHDTDVQKVTLVDGVLKLAMTDKSNQSDDATCEKDGDHVVLEFTRK